ncbi:MAG TPA: hypothetical protein VNG33_15170 [Polyangiaceae bacterium]|nr:hypothetical protein [Polyangiaceae bacterium]
MAEIRRAERNKRPGVSYAVTNDGLELPVVDVTHPAFAAELSEEKQQALVSQFLDEQRRFARLPKLVQSTMMRFFTRGSRIAQGLRRSEGTFLDAMTTYLFKLGPQNLGSYAVPVDRRMLMSLPAISVRLRLSDMARLLADGLAPQLAAAARRPLHLLNIAGGPAVDSLNTLILLRREQAELLSGRRCVIRVLDSEADGPDFGARALAALQEPGAPLAGLDIGFEHSRYDWRDVTGLELVLAVVRSDAALLAVSSEGGLFEYGSDNEVLANLRALAESTARQLFMVGSVTRDDEVIQTLKLTSRAATRPRGLPTFTALIERAAWKVTRSISRPLSDQVLLVPAAAG